jgi:hypothetical protein
MGLAAHIPDLKLPLLFSVSETPLRQNRLSRPKKFGLSSSTDQLASTVVINFNQPPSLSNSIFRQDIRKKLNCNNFD